MYTNSYILQYTGTFTCTHRYNIYRHKLMHANTQTLIHTYKHTHMKLFSRLFLELDIIIWGKKEIKARQDASTKERNTKEKEKRTQNHYLYKKKKKNYYPSSLVIK